MGRRVRGRSVRRADSGCRWRRWWRGWPERWIRARREPRRHDVGRTVARRREGRRTFVRRTVRRLGGGDIVLCRRENGLSRGCHGRCGRGRVRCARRVRRSRYVRISHRRPAQLRRLRQRLHAPSQPQFERGGRVRERSLHLSVRDRLRGLRGGRDGMCLHRELSQLRDVRDDLRRGVRVFAAKRGCRLRVLADVSERNDPLQWQLRQ